MPIDQHPGSLGNVEREELLALQAVPALAALLRHAVRTAPAGVGAHPDGVRVTLSVDGLDVEFLQGELPMYGLGFDA